MKKFELTDEQLAKYDEWKRDLPPLEPATIGGAYSFLFTPTGLGCEVVVIRVDGHKIDLTDRSKW